MASVSASGTGRYLRHSVTFAEMPFNQYVEMGAFEDGLQIDEVVVMHL